MNKNNIEMILYKMFNKELIKIYEIDWFDVERLYKKIGNAPGIYPDTLLLITKIINNCNPKRIVEIGSGVSTLYLTKICYDRNIQFTSYEEKDEWKTVTNNLLKFYNLDLLIESFVELNDVLYDTDIIFIDCSNEIRIKLLESNKLNNIPIVIIDDSERKVLSTSCSKFMSNSKRYVFYTYNGVGRSDRHLFINSINIDVDSMIKSE